MVLDAVSNFVRGNTDAEVGTDDTTVSVSDASIFPDPSVQGEFNVVIWDANNFPRPDQDGDVEIMRVTERDTTADELTVTRGQEMTTAASHPEGSAIHLSPTAKMFSDIESTFADFWDAGTQELTANVNNTNTTTEALEAESVTTDELNTPPTGSLVQLDGDQTVADDSVTSVEWETEVSRGRVSGLLNAGDNVVVVPDGFNFAKIAVSITWDENDVEHRFVRPRINGSAFDDVGMGYSDYLEGINMRDAHSKTAWISVSEGDEIGADCSHITGDSRTLSDNNRNFMEVWLI